ncbi:PB1 domain-containing protein [Tanacetum coccineum]
MEPIYSLWFLFMAYISYSDAKLDSRVKRVFQTYDFYGESGLIQFWVCNTIEGTNDIGCGLTLTDQFCMSNIHDNRLLDYRMNCFDNNNRFIGQQTNVGIWFAGRAAQTGIADHRTRHVFNQYFNQNIDEASGMGQLVVPVYFNHSGAGMKLAGIIELITTQPKESYVADFNQIHNLLMRENLASTYMGKTIKVKYNHHIVKFPLPLSAKFSDLQKQVTMRFKDWENKNLCIKYVDTNRNCHSILSDHELEYCIAESISSRTTVIRMHIEENFTEKYMNFVEVGKEGTVLKGKVEIAESSLANRTDGL